MTEVYHGASCQQLDAANAALLIPAKTTADVEPAPPAAFAGRDDIRFIDRLLAQCDKATASDIPQLEAIVIERMEAGDLSSLASLQLLKALKRRAKATREGS